MRGESRLCVASIVSWQALRACALGVRLLRLAVILYF